MKPFILIAAVALSCSDAYAEPPFRVVGTIEGRGDVVDGDGVLIRGVEVRLQGIAAPEDNRSRVDPGGRAATAALRSLVRGRQVICYLDGSETRGRPVGACEVAGQDVGAVLVRNGFARDCPRFSRGRYARLERAAKADGFNLSAVYRLPSYCHPR